jgi:hypothetical protein
MVTRLASIGLLAVLAGGPVAVPGLAFVGTPVMAAASSGGLNDPCTESAYARNGSHWTTTMRWWFSYRTTPAGLRRRAVQRALRLAAGNITGSRNNCGLADRVSATQSFRGRTTALPDVTASSTCGRPDGKNEVGFGTLAGTDLGLTCYWTRNGRTVEADIKLNKADYAFYAKKPANCAKAWSIQGVATHEFGHAFGLNHVSEVMDGALTMSPLILPCQNSESTLGLGDVRGLRSLY